MSHSDPYSKTGAFNPYGHSTEFNHACVRSQKGGQDAGREGSREHMASEDAKRGKAVKDATAKPVPPKRGSK
ncbi:hypothetical protein PG989_003674 [Apiospora arundinis]